MLFGGQSGGESGEKEYQYGIVGKLVDIGVDDLLFVQQLVDQWLVECYLLVGWGVEVVVVFDMFVFLLVKVWIFMWFVVVVLLYQGKQNVDGVNVDEQYLLVEIVYDLEQQWCKVGQFEIFFYGVYCCGFCLFLLWESGVDYLVVDWKVWCFVNVEFEVVQQQSFQFYCYVVEQGKQ